VELFSITLKGYRRFKTSQILRTNGKLVALLGPNEAGKSSCLAAIASLNDDLPFFEGDVCRGFDEGELEVGGRFSLTDDELTAAGLSGPIWFTVTKKFAGNRRYGFYPKKPLRDISHRRSHVAKILRALENRAISSILNEEDEHLSPSYISSLETVVTDSPSLSTNVLEFIDVLRHELTRALEKGKATKVLTDAVDAINSLVETERSADPAVSAIKVLQPLLPHFAIFGEEDRDLATVYSVDDLSSHVPPALQGVLTIADLDITDFLAAASSGSGPKMHTLEAKANILLEKRFKEAWQQSGVHIALKLSAGLLEVHVVNEGVEFTSFDERSDGLRQFVALQAFAMKKRLSNPVLLIDEAEQRLHYDGQADLMQMLARQSLASKVIISTHSAGCLPEDLGNGVRLISYATDDRTTSEISNKFWKSREPGILPILIGMGAGSLAFFPTRQAVIVEGPSDILLLPTLFRAALNVPTLGYQFVPGLSEACSLAQEVLANSGSSVTYLVDGDPGGLKLRSSLIQRGVNANRIYSLATADGNAVELEDFIAPSLLLKAANVLIADYAPNCEKILIDDLRPVQRMACLERAYLDRTGEKISKVKLAYVVLDQIAEFPGKNPLDQRRIKAFRNIAKAVETSFLSPLPANNV
jgi:predicted ATP-dependent endonuclease of OLD family